MTLKQLFFIVTCAAIYIPCLGVAANIAARHDRSSRLGWPMEGVEKFMTGISNLHEHPFDYGCILFAVALGGACFEAVLLACAFIAWEEWIKKIVGPAPQDHRSKPDASPSLPSV